MNIREQKTPKKQWYNELYLVTVPTEGQKYEDTHKGLAGYAIFIADGDPCPYLAPYSPGLIKLCEEDGVLPRRLTPEDCPLRFAHAPERWATVTYSGGQFTVTSNGPLKPLE